MGLWCILFTDKLMAETPALSKNQILFMETMIEESPVILKTKELCQAILDQASMQSIRQRVDAFMADDKSRAQYEGVMTKGQALQQKQQNSMPLSGAEITELESQ